ncbi:MAG: YgjV family protein [Firmicutes bacterium]|nr:YgjV family protein [Bacillota bacterium]
MFELDFGSWQWVISQLVGIIAIVLVVFAFQSKTKKRALFLFCLTSALWAISSALVENYVATAIYATFMLRNAAFLWLETKGKNSPGWVSGLILGICILISVVAVIYTRVWWFDWLLLGANVLKVYGAWRRGIHWIRVVNFVFLPLIIFNHFWFSNYMGVIGESVALISVTIFYMRFFANRKKINNQQNNESTIKIEESISTDEIVKN